MESSLQAEGAWSKKISKDLASPRMNMAIFSSNGSNLYRSFKSFEKSIPSYPKVWSRVVQREVGLAVRAKNVELHKFHAELEAAKEQVRALQQQILAFKSRDDPIIERDEEYFNSQCKQLCGHVQQWVLTFSAKLINFG